MARRAQVFQHYDTVYPGTVITVTTTVIITLKIFDVVWVMTGGQFGTDDRHSSTGSPLSPATRARSAIAIVLLIAVVPVMIYNLRQPRNGRHFYTKLTFTKISGAILVNGVLLCW